MRPLRSDPPGPVPAPTEADLARTRRRRSGRGVLDVADALAEDPELGPRFQHWERTPARPGAAVPLPEALDPRLRTLLQERGQASLWTHQARAFELALAGEDVLVATPTASGKTLCYTAPVLQRLLETGGRSRSIFLFPTKALSQDQSAGLNALIEGLGEPWHSYTYDGDTPPSVRRTLRDSGHVLLTNPWMLHAGILPNHAKWSELFSALETVVIDEVHTLSGVFGSSVANVLRRLRRIAAHYGSRPRFLLSSATLRDPAAHAQRLIGRPVQVVDEDGSPAGERRFGVYNPPMLDPVAGLRANALEEARRLAHRLAGPNHQTIFFCNRRTAVEVLTRYLKEEAREMGLVPEEIRGYRGGYLPLLRREIESGLRDGSVKVVVTTNALELGIDVGRLDVAVLVGYPGSQASFWQRLGRAGRRGAPSLGILVARSDPIDQYLALHPEHLLGAARERIGVDPDNLVILSEHVKCAAFELPFREPELADPTTPFGSAPHAAEVLDYLAEESGLLLKRGEAWHWMADAYPAQDVTLSGNDPDNVLVLDVETTKAIGEIDREGSITAVHEGAIYQVEGETWIVERFDYENRRAYVRRVESDYFTEAETDTELRVLRLERRRTRPLAPEPPSSGEDAPEGPADDRYGVLVPRPGPAPRPEAESSGDEAEDCSVWSGEVHVTTLATQYKKVRFYTREDVGNEDIHLPPEELDTQAFCLTMSAAAAERLGLVGAERGAAWRGVGRMLRRVAPLFLRCQPSDLGLSTEVRSGHFGRPTIYLWDRVMGGVGLGDLLFEAHHEVFRAAREVVERCECRSGCPVCVGPPHEAGLDGKHTAVRVLAHLAEGPPLIEVETDDDPVEPAVEGAARAPATTPSGAAPRAGELRE